MDLKHSYGWWACRILDKNTERVNVVGLEPREYKWFQNRLFIKKENGYSEMAVGNRTGTTWFRVSNPDTIRALDRLPSHC